MQLIDAALAAGSIDREQALIYKMFAEFSDPRLPAEFVGRPSQQRRHAHRRGSRAGLAGSLRRHAADPGAVLHPADLRRQLAEQSSRRGGNANALTATAKAKGAARLAAAEDEPNPCPRPILEGRTDQGDGAREHPLRHVPIRNGRPRTSRLQTARCRPLHRGDLRQRRPSSSAAHPPSDATIHSGCNGGDGALDITIIPEQLRGARTMATTTPPWSHGSVRPGLQPDALAHPDARRHRLTWTRIRNRRSATFLAHEVFHAIEFGYPRMRPAIAPTTTGSARRLRTGSSTTCIRPIPGRPNKRRASLCGRLHVCRAPAADRRGGNVR